MPNIGIIFSRCVPDWRGVGTLLALHLNRVRHLDSKSLRVVGLPGRRRDLKYASVVDGAVLWIKFGIGPSGTQFGIADIIDIAGIGHIDRVTHGCFTATVRIDLAAIGNCYIVNPFVPLATLVNPPLYDLNTIQVAGLGILEGSDHEHRGFFVRWLLWEVSPHRHTLTVTD